MAALLFAASPLHAQPTPSWNRKAEGMSVLPVPVAGDSFFDITFYASIDASDLSAPTDLSTELEIRVNGVTVDTEVHTLTANPGSSGDCSGLPCGGEPCICTPPPVVCECGPVIISTSATASLQPEDEIMILLRPAPGALPDSDESDDLQNLHFPGEPLFWNRRIASVEIVPSPGPELPDVFFDVWVECYSEANYDGRLNLGSSLELWIDGVEYASMPTGPNDFVWSYCNLQCTDTCVIDGSVPAGSCEPVPNDCICQTTPGSLVFPSVPLEPDDELTIILRPVPGALPELPGFPDDEETRPVCPWDCGDGDFVVGITDFLAMLAQWGEVGASCDFDGGGVGITDFLKLLGQWGPCFPM